MLPIAFRYNFHDHFHFYWFNTQKVLIIKDLEKGAIWKHLLEALFGKWVRIFQAAQRMSSGGEYWSFLPQKPLYSWLLMRSSIPCCNVGVISVMYSLYWFTHHGSMEWEKIRISHSHSEFVYLYNSYCYNNWTCTKKILQNTVWILAINFGLQFDSIFFCTFVLYVLRIF